MMIEGNKKIDWLKFLINFVGITLIIAIILGSSTFIFGESNKTLNYFGTIFISLFYISGAVFWIIMLVHSAKSKKWGYFFGILISWLLGAIFYYLTVYKLPISKDLSEENKKEEYNKSIKYLMWGIGISVIFVDIVIIFFIFKLYKTLGQDGLDIVGHGIIYQLVGVIILSLIFGYIAFRFLKSYLLKNRSLEK